jgi:error-prone DNA polymerase
MPVPKVGRRGGSAYVELHAHSSHSLLDGVPSPEALVERAAHLDMLALALTDHDGIYGAVRFMLAAREAGIKPILGAEMTIAGPSLPLPDPVRTRWGRGMGDEGHVDPFHLTLLVETAEGYANLCRLITLARRGQEKGVALLARHELAAHTGGLIALSGCRRGEIARLVLDRQFERALEVAQGYAQLFGPDRFFIELQRHHRQGDSRLMAGLLVLADRTKLDLVATGDVHYLHPHEHQVHDILTCIRHRTTLDDGQHLLRPNTEYLLRSPTEMADLFSSISGAVANSCRIAERCAPAGDYLPSGPQVLPRFLVPEGGSAQGYLRQLCLQALSERHGGVASRDQLERELAVIEQADLADYFLIVWDIVRFSRQAGIRCQGRGSAANSMVAYLLGITPVDPVACDLVFERFLSPERNAPPDIDVDFAADRREEVIQYVYQRYGEEHAAMACTMVTFRARSAVRDVARALGFPPPLVERLAGALDVRNAESVEESRGLTEAFGGGLEGRPFQHLLRIVPLLDGIPRHLGIHNGGMVLSGPPLCEIVPLEPATMPDRVVTQWDKDGLEGAGMIKIDILGLRMLSAIEDAVAIVEAQTGEMLDLDQLSPDDPAVYDMLCRGETIGVFQVESRAQSSLIPRYQPRSFTDLVIEISLIRPGPIQAQMVHPYLQRRLGVERPTYLHPLMEPALAETLGVMVFQEQVLKVARDVAGFTPGRADLLRRALSHKRATEKIVQFHDEFVAGAVANGLSQEVAEQVFGQLLGFGGYSFPKSHAAAFAVLTYQSAWLRCYHPAAFFAGLLRHQPMGFYPPHVVVSDARRSGVEIQPADVEASAERATVDGQALRLGLAVVTGLGEEGAQKVVEARRRGHFHSLADFCRRTRLGRRAVEAMIMAGAFDRWGVSRRQLLWDLREAIEAAEGPPAMALMSPNERPRFSFLSDRMRLWTEVAHTGIAANAHLNSLVNHELREIGATPSRALHGLPNGSWVWVGGVVASAQRPPTAKGVAFLALEDEGGMINVVLKPEVYEANRRALKSPFVAIQGRVQKRGRTINILARSVVPIQLDAGGTKPSLTAPSSHAAIT